MRPQLIEVEGETHSHGPEGAHTHSSIASTTWLSPSIRRAQAEAIAGGLKPFFPAPRRPPRLQRESDALRRH
jgi:zinc transport system substrate-binding protein